MHDAGMDAVWGLSMRLPMAQRWARTHAWRVSGNVIISLDCCSRSTQFLFGIHVWGTGSDSVAFGVKEVAVSRNVDARRAVRRVSSRHSMLNDVPSEDTYPEWDGR